jgi:hypothetical protein
MNTFGIIKSKLLSKLTESYRKNNKQEIKNILNTIKENKDFKEMYLLYEDIESKYYHDKETATFFVEELSQVLKGKKKTISKTCKQLNESIGLVETKNHKVYDYLDILLEDDNLLNIGVKVKAKIDLVNYLMEKKEINEKVDTYSNNENLLHVVLANNFNVLYDNQLNENEKEQLKSILSMSNDDVITKIKELKESITSKIETLLQESNDNSLLDKLIIARDEVDKMTPSKYNYYKLVELKNGLN